MPRKATDDARPVRVVTLPNGRQVPLADYIDAWRRLRHDIKPDEQIVGFFHCAAPASEILQEFRAGLHDRINRHDPRFRRGRRWDSDHQAALRRDAYRLNTPRLLIRTLETDEARARFSDRISREEY